MITESDQSNGSNEMDAYMREIQWVEKLVSHGRYDLINPDCLQILGQDKRILVSYWLRAVGSQIGNLYQLARQDPRENGGIAEQINYLADMALKVRNLWFPNNNNTEPMWIPPSDSEKEGLRNTISLGYTDKVNSSNFPSLHGLEHHHIAKLQLQAAANDVRQWQDVKSNIPEGDIGFGNQTLNRHGKAITQRISALDKLQLSLIEGLPEFQFPDSTSNTSLDNSGNT